MKAEIKYVMRNIVHPWNFEARRDDVYVWALIKQVITANGSVTSEEAVAVFNYDSEAVLFQEHLFEHGSNEVEFDPNLRRLFDMRREGVKVP